MKDFTVEIYETADGCSQLRDFIDDMDEKTHAKFIAYTRLLRDYGQCLRMPYSEHLEDSIFELRINVSEKFTRVLYFFIKGNRIIMTNGFIKKTNKTPRNEIDKAIRYRNDYLRRMNNND